MVRTYKRKTNRCFISEHDIKKAIREVLNKDENISSAARKYGIDRTTLSKRIKKLNKSNRETQPDSGNSSDDDICHYSSKYSSRQIFTNKQEIELNNYFKTCSKMQFGLTFSMARRFVYDYARINKIKRPSQWDANKQAGMDWLQGFMKRNSDLSLRKPENTSLARINAFNEKDVMQFFENLKTVYEQHHFTAKDIYNLDETGISTVLAPPKVIATKGERTVSQVSSAERGILVTLVGIINAAGNIIPPVYIFPRLRYSERFVQGGPTGCLGLPSKSGWMTAELFLQVLKHIQNYSKCSRDSPILLVLDNHSSHCSLESVLFCRENGIILISFPPHTSHRMQPLDVAIYGPFKRFCSTSFNDYMVNNPGKTISIYDVASLSKTAFYKAFSTENIVKSFEKTGIYPFNSQVFSNSEFEKPFEHITGSTQNILNIADELSEIASNFPSSSASQTQSDSVFGKKTKLLTPEQVRPVGKIQRKVRCDKRKGKSRIFTNSPEKDRLEELERNRKEKTKLKLKRSKIVQESSSEDEHHYSTIDTDESLGPLSDDESILADELEGVRKFLICDDDVLNINDYVLVKFESGKTTQFYAGKIEKIYDENPPEYEVRFLRKKSASFIFQEPPLEDIALVYRKDMILKLPEPTHPAGTSRMALQYLFDIDLMAYNIK